MPLLFFSIYKKSNSKYRCQVDNCKVFYHSTNNFGAANASKKGQNQPTFGYKHKGDDLIRNQSNFTNRNNSSSWNKNSSSTKPNYNHELDKTITVNTTNNPAKTQQTTTATTTSVATAATTTQTLTTTIMTATTDITRTSITGNRIKCLVHPIFSKSNQLRETSTTDFIINNISTQQTKICKVSQATITVTRTTLAVTIRRVV